MSKTIYTDKNNEIINKMILLEKDSSEYIELRNQLVQNNVYYIEKIIKEKCSEALNYCSYEDLYQSCLVLLFECIDPFIEKYKKNKNIYISAYINNYLTHHIKYILEENLPVHVKSIDDCDIDDLLCDSLDEMYDNDEEGYLYDKSSNDLIIFGSIKKDYDLNSVIEDAEFRRIIYNEVMRDFSEKQRKVFFNYFSDPNRTLEETGKFLGVTRPNVDYILKRCLFKLRHPYRIKKFFDWDCSRDRWVYKRYKKGYAEELNKAFDKKYAWECWETHQKIKEETIMERAKKVAEKAAEEKVVTEEKKAVQEETPKTVYTGQPKKDIVEDIVDESIESVKASRRSTRMRMNEKKSNMEKIAGDIGVANPALALAMQAQMHLDANQIDKLTTMIENDDVFVTQAEYISFYVKPMMDYLNKIVLRDYPHLKVKLLDDKDHANYVFEDKTVKVDKQKTTETSEGTKCCPKGFISFRVLEDILNLINECKRNIYTPSTDFYDKVIEDILLAVNTNKYGISRILYTMDELIELKGKIKEILEKVNTSENNIIKNTLLNDIANVINKYNDLDSLDKPEQIDKFIDDIVKQGNKSVKGELEE